MDNLGFECGLLGQNCVQHFRDRRGWGRVLPIEVSDPPIQIVQLRIDQLFRLQALGPEQVKPLLQLVTPSSATLPFRLDLFELSGMRERVALQILKPFHRHFLSVLYFKNLPLQLSQRVGVW